MVRNLRLLKISDPISNSGAFIFPRRPRPPVELPDRDSLYGLPMSISPQLRAAARSVYRDLWRASATTFTGAIGPFSENIVIHSYLHLLTWQATHPYFLVRQSLPHVVFSFLCRCLAFRQKIRKDVLERYPVTDEDVFRKNLELGREIADFLRKNIIQAERLPVQPGKDESETYSTPLFWFPSRGGFSRHAELRILEHTELGDNASIKNPENMVEMPRRGRRKEKEVVTAE